MSWPKGRPCSLETKAKISNALVNRKKTTLPPEREEIRRQKLREAALRQFSDPKKREAVSLRRRGKTYTEIFGESEAARLRNLHRIQFIKNPAEYQERRKSSELARRRSWTKEVKERDNYTCKRCSKNNLTGRSCHAHHKKPIQFYPELRFEVSNGETLCNKCHRKADGEFAKNCILTLRRIEIEASSMNDAGKFL